jgi:hypothetical protein
MDNEQLLEQIATLIAANGAELHTQIQELEERMNARFSALEASVKKIGDAQIGYLKGSVAFMEWAQRSDELVLSMLKRIDALERKLNNPEAA